MKRLFVLLSALLIILVLATCNDNTGTKSEGTSGERPSLSVSEEEPTSRLDSTSESSELLSTAQFPKHNLALDRIEGFEEMEDGVLLAIKNYYYEMRWTEANRIENLERYDFRDQNAYFLVAPCYPGSRIVVEALKFDGAKFAPDGILYELDSTPDDYALIVNSIMPEGGPDKQVVVEYGDKRAVFQFGAIGLRGDEPVPRMIQDAYYTDIRNIPSGAQDDKTEPDGSLKMTDGTVLLRTADDLREFSRIANSGDPNYLHSIYLLGNDIDMAGENLEPIGQFIDLGGQQPNSDGFNAIFDGQGFTIRNLKISRTMTDPEQKYNTGLFALIGQHGQVKNLRLEDCDISFVSGGELSLGGNATGGLAGMSYGTVMNCIVSGKVVGNYQVGGLIGLSGSGSTVDNCSVNVSVTGESEIGAFIGSLHDALITSCSASGEVTAVNLPGGYDRPRGIGGFSGFMVMGTVRDCQSSAYVKTADSSDWVGGFMGYNQGEITSCLYDGRKTAGWDPVDVEYQGAVSDVRDISK